MASRFLANQEAVFGTIDKYKALVKVVRFSFFFFWVGKLFSFFAFVFVKLWIIAVSEYLKKAWYKHLGEIDVQYSSNQLIQKSSQSNLNAKHPMQNAGLVCRIHRLRVDGRRIRKENKEKVADSIPGYVWRRPKYHVTLFIPLLAPGVVNR